MMPRQNFEKALAASRRNGVGPIYRHLLAFETAQDRRFGRVGDMRRPRYLLEALQADEPVEVSAWRVPVELRPPGCGSTVVVTMDM